MSSGGYDEARFGGVANEAPHAYCPCRRRVSLVFGSIAIAEAKPSSKEIASAAAFLRNVAEMRATGQAGRSYEFLVPAQRAVVDRATFVASCSTNGGVQISDWHVKDAYAETALVPGTSVRVKTIAVTIEYTASQGVLKQTTTVTAHAIKMKHGWSWAMSQKQFDACAGGAAS